METNYPSNDTKLNYDYQDKSILTLWSRWWFVFWRNDTLYPSNLSHILVSVFLSSINISHTLVYSLNTTNYNSDKIAQYNQKHRCQTHATQGVSNLLKKVFFFPPKTLWVKVVSLELVGVGGWYIPGCTETMTPRQ